MIRDTLLCVGASHRTAPVAFLESAMRAAARLPSLVFDGAARDDDGAATHDPGASVAYPAFAAVNELAVLTTCNRVEVYAACSAEAVDAVGNGLAHALDASGDPAHLYRLSGRDVVTHLCRVSAGLDSAVIGEPEIAGQVARAFQMIAHRNGGPRALAAAARSARIAGRRARGETAISRGPASFSTVAVQCVREFHGDLAGRHVVVLGAGRMAALVCASLRAAQAAITIVNRSAERASTLAAVVQGRTASFEELAALLCQADAVIAITSAREPVLHAHAFQQRTPAPLIVVDLAVPRNVAADVSTCAGVCVVDMDGLRRRAGSQLEERRREVPRVEAIIAEEVSAFERDDSTMLPLIGDLHRHAERIRTDELERALRGLDTVDEPLRQRIEHLSRALVNKLLHGPSARLRAAADDDIETYERVLRELFALDGNG
jgi:glutamyl-tRNA reductase